MTTIRLFLVDDERHVRRGLRMRLEMEPDLRVVGEAGDGATAVAMIADLDPDVVLMDVDLPGEDGITVARELLAAAPERSVVMVSMQDDQVTRAAALAAGASGFVGKHEVDIALIDAIRLAAEGRCRCRGREPPMTHG